MLLKVFKVKNKEEYENLNKLFSGIFFFRSENNNFYIKAPINDSVTELIDLGIIEELPQDS